MIKFKFPSFRKFLVYLALYGFLFAIFFSIEFMQRADVSYFGLLRQFMIVFATILLVRYFIYMTLSPWNEIRHLRRRRALQATKPKVPYQPKVSVIVPAWNEEIGIVTTIAALHKSTYTNLEVIVIDNASKDRTAERVRGFIDQQHRLQQDNPDTTPIQVIYSYEAKQGKGYALNNGLALATGDIIVSIDADCYVPPESIGNFVRYFEDPLVMAAVGNVRIGNTETIVGVVQYLEFLFSFYFKKTQSLINTIYIIGGAAGAFRREVFERIGPYSTTNITEDFELSVRIQGNGMRIAYASDALVYTEGAVTLTGLMKQRLRWKRGRFETFAEHRNLFFSLKKDRNVLFSWFVLPLAIIDELRLPLEILFLTLLYILSFVTGDFTPFLSVIAIVASMFIILIVFDNHREAAVPFLLLAPIGWLLFYVSTLVETNAMFRALWGYMFKKELTWQKWERKGVFLKKKN